MGRVPGGVLPKHFLWTDARMYLSLLLLLYLSTNPRPCPLGLGLTPFVLFTYSQPWGRTKGRSWPDKPQESCKPTASPAKRRVYTRSSGSMAGKPYAWPKKSSPEEGFSRWDVWARGGEPWSTQCGCHHCSPCLPKCPHGKSDSQPRRRLSNGGMLEQMGWGGGRSCLAAGMGPEAEAGCEGQEERGEELGQSGLSTAQGWEPMESKDLRRTSLCSAMAWWDRVLSQAGKQERGRALPNKGHEWVGSAAGLNVRRLLAQLQKGQTHHPLLHLSGRGLLRGGQRGPGVSAPCAIAPHCSRGRSGVSTSAASSAGQKIKRFQVTRLRPTGRSHCQKSRKWPLHVGNSVGENI